MDDGADRRERPDVEQPVPAWNLGAMARLRARPDTPPLLADECVFDHHDMLAVANAAAADAISLKLVKHAGLIGVRKVAAVAEAAGIELYGGCLLESSVGAAAHLAGLPGVSVPCGLTGSGLPIGLQIQGRVLDDLAVLRAARTFERELALSLPWPSLT